MKNLLRGQLWHLLATIVLVILFGLVFRSDPAFGAGHLWGLGTAFWFWLAVADPIAHQFVVMLIWRLELLQRSFTSRWGMRAFSAYALIFMILFVGRLATVILAAVSNRGMLPIAPATAFLLAGLLSPLPIYLFYSVARYFTLRRALGIDHFIEGYDEPFVRGGIFRYSSNAMYIFGMLVLYLPGLLLLSPAALLAALFNHVYIWAHYFFTERPDMESIYGAAPRSPGR